MGDGLTLQTTTSALAVLRDGHRDVDGLLVPPPPADPELRVHAHNPLRLAVVAAAAAAAFLFVVGLVPGVPLMPFAIAANALMLPAVIVVGLRDARWAKRRVRALALLEAGDVDAAEMRLRTLARRYRGTTNGAVALLDVAGCVARRGDVDGALAIYGDLEASRVLANDVKVSNRVEDEAARLCERKGDADGARRWRARIRKVAT